LGIGDYLAKRGEEKRQREWEEHLMNTYPVNLQCINCGHQTIARIMKGISVEEWSQYARCKECELQDTFRPCE